MRIRIHFTVLFEMACLNFCTTLVLNTTYWYKDKFRHYLYRGIGTEQKIFNLRANKKRFQKHLTVNIKGALVELQAITVYSSVTARIVIFIFFNLCNFGKKSTSPFVRKCASKLSVKYIQSRSIHHPEYIIPGFSRIFTDTTLQK